MRYPAFLLPLTLFGLVFVAAANPLPAQAQTEQLSPFQSFGGRVLSIIPCALGLHVTIQPAGVFPISYIWTPATLTFLYGPPRPGVQLLGSAYRAPAVCPTLTTPPVPLPGLIMFMVGTSAVI